MDIIEDFPFRNNIYNDKDRIEIFEQLLKMNLSVYRSDYLKGKIFNLKLPKWVYVYEGQFNYLMYDPKMYKYYMLSDLFNDECRVKCSFGSHISPFEYYKQNKQVIMEQLKKKKIETTPVNIREQIYMNHKECSIHNPLIIKYFIKKYNAKNVCDISSGWGDRLIGSLLSDVDIYFGVDPNSCLHSNYDKIIKLFNPLTKNKGTYKIVEGKFEETELPDVKFDLMYTSPPYFKYEKYPGSTAEPNFTHSEQDWLQQFLYPSINKVIDKLRINGHIVFYFSQEEGQSYIEEWLKYMMVLPNIYYIGNYLYGDMFIKSLHPIFVFKYSKNIPVKLYNPKFQTHSHKFENIVLNVVREDRLMGGSKQRAVVPYIQNLLKNNEYDELVYFGASNGYAMVAIAYSLYLLKSNVKVRIYCQNTKNKDSYQIKQLASSIYPYVKIVDVNSPMRTTWPQIEAYLESNKRSYLIPFGLDDPKYKQLLHESLKDNIDSLPTDIKRLWIVVGSGTLFSTLYDLLPNVFFCLVQVGKQVDLSRFDSKRYKLYISSVKLYGTMNQYIPYPTTNSYDGKIFEFKKDFLNGDWIWNTAGMHKRLN